MAQASWVQEKLVKKLVKLRNYAVALAISGQKALFWVTCLFISSFAEI